MYIHNMIMNDSRRQELQEITGFRQLSSTNIGNVIQAHGIYLRLCSKVPVLLVGDLKERFDRILGSLVAHLLRLEHLNLHVENVTNDPRCGTGTSTTHLFIVYCDTIERADLLDNIYNEKRCTIASLHFPSLSIIELQRQLPSKLRGAVVFI